MSGPNVNIDSLEINVETHAIHVASFFDDFALWILDVCGSPKSHVISTRHCPLDFFLWDVKQLLGCANPKQIKHKLRSTLCDKFGGALHQLRHRFRYAFRQAEPVRFPCSYRCRLQALGRRPLRGFRLECVDCFLPQG